MAGNDASEDQGSSGGRVSRRDNAKEALESSSPQATSASNRSPKSPKSRSPNISREGTTQSHEEELTFNGSWSMDGTTLATIDGTTLTGSSGIKVVLELISSTRFRMNCEGQSYTAELQKDGSLHWKNGDVWTRAHAPDQAEPKEPTDQGSPTEAADKDGDGVSKDDYTEEQGEISVNTFEELRLSGSLVGAAQDAWRIFMASAESPEAAGEAIYSALFESAPSIQALFTTPRAVQAMRFMNGLRNFVTELDDPVKLKVSVETLGFGHLHLDVTIPRVVIFRDAILDLFQLELGERLTSNMYDGWKRLLNYVGGAIIFVKAHYADRIACLLRSWKICNKGDDKAQDDAGASSENRQEAESSHSGNGVVEKWQDIKKKTKTSMWRVLLRRRNENQEDTLEDVSKGNGEDMGGTQIGFKVQNVPTTYPDMFLFNAAVMGFGQSEWMREVLECFPNIVVNVANSARLQQECAILALRISKTAAGQINLTEYKSCMLASLRSLLPKDWDSSHEVSWTWLWENVERLLLTIQGKPPVWEKSLGKFLDSLDEDQRFEARKEIYYRFFSGTPAGQDYFKQSNTYLHFIAERIIQMTMELYRDPSKMVDDLSALGLRHVGYGIPPEMFGPFVTACVEVVRTMSSDDNTVEAFRFSLGLISQILCRTITEGSTVVMKAININRSQQMRKAIGCAPRGERAKWMLMVQVGSQNISPLAWSLESGSLEATVAIIKDLLTIRADRERYYYGLDELFKRHPDIIDVICTAAPALLPTLLDGLVWRSRQTDGGMRRVNYYVKHLLVDEDGNFSKTLEWITRLKDPKIVCHPVIILVSGLMWRRVVYPTFLYGKTWFLFTLMLFITCQSVLEYVNEHKGTFERSFVFACRTFIYLCSMTQLIYSHARDSFKAFRGGNIFQVLFFWVPCYLNKWQETASLALGASLVIMLCLEPIASCWKRSEEVFSAECTKGSGWQSIYEFCSMTAMFLYYVLLIDFAAISTRVSAFVLICIRMISEVALFLGAVVVVTLTFSSAISVVKHDNDNFAGILPGVYSLSRMTLNMFDSRLYAQLRDEPAVLFIVCVFLVCVVIFLGSLFIAQLSCAYNAVYDDMVGYARLERGVIIVEMMPNVPKARWFQFAESMQFQKRLEFNSGDIGLAGGLQVLEPQRQNPTNVDIIRRFGGSTSQEMQWPAEEDNADTENDSFERMEKLMQKTLKRITSTAKRRGRGGQGDSGSGEVSGSGHKGSSSSSKSSGSNEEDEG